MKINRSATVAPVAAPVRNGRASAPVPPPARRAPAPPVASTPESRPATTPQGAMGHGRRDVPLMCPTCGQHTFNSREGKLQQSAMCIASQAVSAGRATDRYAAIDAFARQMGVTNYAGRLAQS